MRRIDAERVCLRDSRYTHSAGRESVPYEGNPGQAETERYRFSEGFVFLATTNMC